MTGQGIATATRLNHQLVRRQPSQCLNQCAWVANADSCTDLGCDCQVIADAGQIALSNCYQCSEAYNGTFADRLLSFAVQCNLTSVSTPLATTITMLPCEGQCGWSNNAESCTDIACDCQVIQSAGFSAFMNCLTCAEESFTTYAGILTSLNSECQVLAGSTPFLPQPTNSVSSATGATIQSTTTIMSSPSSGQITALPPVTSGSRRMEGYLSLVIVSLLMVLHSALNL